MNSRTEGRPCDEGVTEMITARGMGPGRSPFMAKADVPGAVVSDRPGRLISKPFTTQTRDRQACLKAVHDTG